MLRRKYKQRPRDASGITHEITDSAYGSVKKHIHSIAAFAFGSIIPGGRFVVNTPEYAQSLTQVDRSIMLPDSTGELLFYNDEVTDFSEEIANALDADGNFRFVGLSCYAGHHCRDRCEDLAECCPIGYNDEQSRWNFVPLRQPADILTKGEGYAYTESEFTTNDKVYVRTKQIDPEAPFCQFIGGVTAIPDDGTQEIHDVRVELGAAAGSSVLLSLNL